MQSIVKDVGASAITLRDRTTSAPVEGACPGGRVYETLTLLSDANHTAIELSGALRKLGI